MRERQGATVAGGAALLVTLAALASAGILPYDFRGRWTGTIASPGGTVSLTADFTPSSETRFSGPLVVSSAKGTLVCTARGHRARRVVVRITCPDRTRGVLSGALDLAAGAVAGSGRFHRVRGPLELVKETAVCGDGRLQASEQCDDGNVAAGDGCGPTCAVEARAVTESEPNDTAGAANDVGTIPVVVGGAITPVSDVDVFRFVLDATADVTLQTYDGAGPGHCGPGTDTFLVLRRGDGTVIATDDDGGLNLCSRIDADGLAPGAYFAVVRGPFLSTTVAAYRLSVYTR